MHAKVRVTLFSSGPLLIRSNSNWYCSNDWIRACIVTVYSCPKVNLALNVICSTECKGDVDCLTREQDINLRSPSGLLVLSHLGFAFVHPTETKLPTYDAFRTWPIYRMYTVRGIWEVSIEYMQRVWPFIRGRWLLRTPGSVPALGLACVKKSRPICPELVLFPD